jgi:HlyD family secretion protein
MTGGRGTFSGGPGGQRGGPGRFGGRGERPAFHTVYVLTGADQDAKLQATQIRTGITDGIDTEVISGLDEGAQVVTGVVSTGPAMVMGPSANPLRGGFRRR